MSREALVQLVLDRAAQDRADVILHALDVAGGAVGIGMTHEELGRLQRPGAHRSEAVASAACSSSSSPDPATAGP